MKKINMTVKATGTKEQLKKTLQDAIKEIDKYDEDSEDGAYYGNTSFSSNSSENDIVMEEEY